MCCGERTVGEDDIPFADEPAYLIGRPSDTFDTWGLGFVLGSCGRGSYLDAIVSWTDLHSWRLVRVQTQRLDDGPFGNGGPAVLVVRCILEHSQHSSPVISSVDNNPSRVAKCLHSLEEIWTLTEATREKYFLLLISIIWWVQERNVPGP